MGGERVDEAGEEQTENATHGESDSKAEADVEPWVRRLTVIAVALALVGSLGGSLLEVAYTVFGW